MMKAKHNLKRGEIMFSFHEVVSAVKWQDSKSLCLLTTGTSPKILPPLREETRTVQEVIYTVQK